VTREIARIDWKMGQTLLPEHFIAQEQSLVADVAARFGLLGVPFHGVGRLRWNESLLQEGIVAIAALSAVLPTGRVLQVPGNAQVQSVNLNTAGATKVSVYLHLTSDRAAKANDSRGDEGGDEERVERIVESVVLTLEPTQRNAVSTIKLAVFEKGLEGAWALSEDYVPPLLQVGSSPFLSGLLERFGKTLQLFDEQLRQDIAASFLGGEGLFSAKLCLKGVLAIQRIIANVKGQVHLHPYHLYEALKTFYVDVCIYQGVAPVEVDAPYRHEDISACYLTVTKPLFERLQASRGKTPYLSFEKKDGVHIVSTIPQETRTAKEVYFLLQKPKVNDVISLDGLKLASRTRLPSVHQMSLVGIPVRKLERPPFQHQFGAEVEFYRLMPGDEWDHALREGSLAFFDAPAFSKARAYLYWRNV
jgi:type VI secretion system protein ImpJ